MAQDTLLTGKINAPCSTYAPARHLYHSNGSLKFEPIVHLSTAQLIGYHVLTQRPPGHDSEAFFQQLSPEALYNHVFQQIDALRFFPQNIRYFLNLPVKVLINDDALLLKLCSSSSNITIKLQDPDIFYTLSTRQLSRLYKRIQQLEAVDFPSGWMTSMKKCLLPFLIKTGGYVELNSIKKHSGTLYQSCKNCARLFLLDIRLQPMC